VVEDLNYTFRLEALPQARLWFPFYLDPSGGAHNFIETLREKIEILLKKNSNISTVQSYCKKKKANNQMHNNQ
jgi:hypothetical protein